MRRVSVTGVVAVLMLGLLAGCTGGGGGTVPAESPAAPRQMTADELAYFNSDKFFNGVYIHNQFLNSLYNEPAEIDLFALFRDGIGNGRGWDKDSDAEREAQLKAYLAAIGASEAMTGITKVTRADMNTILLENTGIGFDQTKKTGLDQFVYLKDYDAYYHMHGDTDYYFDPVFTSGTVQGDLWRLVHAPDWMSDGSQMIATLRKTSDGYLFVSNQKYAA